MSDYLEYLETKCRELTRERDEYLRLWNKACEELARERSEIH